MILRNQIPSKFEKLRKPHYILQLYFLLQFRMPGPGFSLYEHQITKSSIKCLDFFLFLSGKICLNPSCFHLSCCLLCSLCEPTAPPPFSSCVLRSWRGSQQQLGCLREGWLVQCGKTRCEIFLFWDFFAFCRGLCLIFAQIPFGV